MINTYRFSKAAFILLMIITTINGCKKKTTLKEKIPNETSTVTDVEGNIYKTVKIGNKWWMAENLKVKVYNDSTAISEVKATDNDTVWANKKIGAFCKVEENSMRYGLYYNWYTLSNPKKIAPIGWHIPSDEEWKELEIALGISEAEANRTAWRGENERDKIIEKNSNAWSNVLEMPVGNNESGFTALTSGCRLFNGSVGDGKTAFWWTATLNGEEVWYRNIAANHTDIFRYYTYKTYGFSVRCVKD